ncbi:high mobility group nucleosome-binding domain-containing protein 5-like, partial [Ixodes scapularis]|uniref:high mobility group nucleosome-binding domain-containing protein 5-like n=1 Tax=Ixodes scapularis TaxID=6945 RepID=UPI001C389379
MKIQAFPIIAAVAGLLSIVYGAPAGNGPYERADEPEKEDRSCAKRDAEAQKAFTEGKPVDDCNYFCKPDKDVDYYEEKKYPLGTKCMYNGKVSKCIEEGCPYPKESADNDKKGEEQPGKEPDGKEEKKEDQKEENEKENTQGDEENKKEEEEGKPKGDEGHEEEKKEDKKEEEEKEKTQGDEGKKQEEGKPKEDEGLEEEKKEDKREEEEKGKTQGYEGKKKEEEE